MKRHVGQYYLLWSNCIHSVQENECRMSEVIRVEVIYQVCVVLEERMGLNKYNKDMLITKVGYKMYYLVGVQCWNGKSCKS